MMRHSHLEHRFVKHIPDGLEHGVLYVSMEYGTAAHRCCCGCGEEVVTPFTPTDWTIVQILLERPRAPLSACLAGRARRPGLGLGLELAV